LRDVSAFAFPHSAARGKQILLGDYMRDSKVLIHAPEEKKLPIVAGSVQRFDEPTLVAAARRGQEAAFGVLFDRYRQMMLRAALRITQKHEDAEDAVQDSFLSAFLHLKDFDGRSSLSTWLTRIAINCSLMVLRKRRTSREMPMESSNEDGETVKIWEPVDPALNPEKQYAAGQQERIVREAVRRLRPTIRTAIELRQLEELSLKQTASKMGISLAAAKARIFHARRALRKSAVLRPMNQRFSARRSSRFAVAA
jgi:RNA polymerase sigma factor (sigma-70 family)